MIGNSIKFSSKNTILIPIFFILNMMEILLFAKKFTPLYESTDFTYTTFSIAAVLLTVFVITLYRLSEKIKLGEYSLQFNLGLLHFMLVLALLCYIGGAIYLRRYIPGMGTGILLNIPLAAYVFRAVKKLNLLNNRTINISLFIALGLIVLTALSLFIAILVDPLIYPIVIE